MYYADGLTVHKFMVRLISPPGTKETGLLGGRERELDSLELLCQTPHPSFGFSGFTRPCGEISFATFDAFLQR